MPLRIFLIRHGETAWSKSGQHTGRTDLSLTAEGERDAVKLGERLRGFEFDRVFCSPRLRALQTYELSGLNPTAEIDPDLAEWDYGDYEGQRTVDIHQVQPRWNLFTQGCPNGEMPEEISIRADRVVARLHAMTGNVALFSHGHLLRVLATRWLMGSVHEAGRFHLDTASISILSREDRSIGEPILLLWNEVCR
jgi:broad specificity phosphatase PhoE